MGLRLMAKTAAVIFLHGLGDTCAGWSSIARQYAAELPHVHWEFPNAPTQPVTCNGGMRMTSWFDIDNIPIDESENDNPKGLGDSIATLHNVIKSVSEKHQIPTERI